VLPPPSAAYKRLPGYPLAGIPELRKSLEDRGVDVIDLGAGDADLSPPPAVVEALTRAAADPANSRYAFQMGVPALRDAIVAWMGGRFGVDLDPFAEVLPLIGSKEGIALLPQVFMNRGDWAVVPDPGYQAYAGGALIAKGRVHRIPLRPENDFLIPLEDIPADILKRTRILYLNYPNNPTAASAPRAYLEDVVAFCHANDLLLVFDNAYSEIAFDGYRPPSILELDGARDIALEFHSFSKTYNMTGWRLGWVAGAASAVAGLRKVKSFVDTGIFRAVQWAGVAALESHGEWVPGNVATFRERRDAAVRALEVAGFDVTIPQATMYLWVPVPEGVASRDFALQAVEKEGVIVMPGGALGDGGEGFFRVALTVSSARLTEAAARLGRVREGLTRMVGAAP
jgi:LL-diaminopimelate aminotransferase